MAAQLPSRGQCLECQDHCAEFIGHRENVRSECDSCRHPLGRHAPCMFCFPNHSLILILFRL